MSKIEVNTVEPQCGTTLTLGGSGDTVQLGTGASQSGFGRTGTVDWQTSSIKTSTFTAANGEGYFCNTTSGAFTVNLPAGSAGAIVSLQDYNNTFDSNALTVAPNGSEKINGGQGSVSLSTEGEGITLVYIDSTVGWRSIQDNDFASVGSDFVSATGGTETTCGDFKIHTFTGPGTFTVTSAGSPSGSDVLEYIVVAGGGGGGSPSGGGGGAGGFRFASPSLAPLCYPGKPLAAPAGLTASGGAFPITIGGGGPASNGSGSGSCSQGSPGNPSTFSTITSTAGGGGASPTGTPGNTIGGPGGSGGGGGDPGGPGAGGTGNTPPVSPPQGNPGGQYQAGGGGALGSGVGNPGTPSPSVTPGGVGAGIPTAFGSNGTPCGSFRYYAAGGAGRFTSSPTIPGPAKGGGGNGGNSGTATNGTANTGGGGGGDGSSGAAGVGGSGIVIIRYKFQ